MKVQASVVIAFLKIIKLQSADIVNTVRSGDDGFQDCVQQQVEDIIKAVDVFQIENLSPLTPIGHPKKKPYLDEAEKGLIEWEPGRAYSENVAIYQSRLYAFIWRTLKELGDISSVKGKEMMSFIETAVIVGSVYEKEVYSREWFHTSLGVIEDVAQEIIEQRAKAPQLLLFSAPGLDPRETRRKGRTLLDLIPD